MVNFTIQELGLDCRNAFVGVYLASDEMLTKRQPRSKNQIRHLQKTCYQIDDNLRWLIALISDIGMRLAEAAGLKIEDLNLDHQHPHITLAPYPHRFLKPKSSERIIPLVGSFLWAAKRIKESSVNEFCFLRYSNKEVCNSNSESAALNKWIKTIAAKDSVIHGLRHSFRDRLREVEAPSELIDQLGGNGYALENMSKWMEKIVI